MTTKKTLSTWLVILMTTLSLPVWAQFSGSGSGTSADPFIITSGDELTQVRNYLNNGNVYFKMLNDVDLTQWIANNNPTQGWNPIGNSSTNAFCGSFNGNNCKIIGLNISRATTDYVGLFGYINGGTIFDLTLSQSKVLGQNYAGILIGYAKEYSTIKNITIQGNLTGKNYTGSLLGYSFSSGNSLINNISIDCDVSGANYTGLFSGFVEENIAIPNKNGYTNISNIKINGNLIGLANVGGLSGGISSLNSPIYNGTIGNNIIGISNMNLSNIVVNGVISGQDQTGGIVGDVNCLSKSTAGTVSGNYYFYSSNSYIFTSRNFFKGTIKGQAKTGGLFGNVVQTITLGYGTTLNDTRLKIENSGFIGEIWGLNYTGGVVGYINVIRATSFTYQNIIDKCYATGAVNGLASCGGIIGESGSSISTTNCHSHCDISGTTSVGGIIGKATNPYTLKNYSAGSVLGTSNVGGILGESVTGGTGTVQSNVSANSIVIGNSNVGRIIGSLSNTETLTSAQSNYGWALTKIIGNNINMSVVDCYQHGISTGLSLLKTKATYQGIGWDFTTANYWSIVEGQSFPYFTWQTPPAIIIPSSIKPGTTTISGTSVANALINIKVGAKKYITTANSLNWSLVVDPLLVGDTISAIAQQDTLRWSYQVQGIVELLGAGTLADPYQIYSARDLNAVNNNMAGNYKLMNDIDLTSWIQTNDQTNGWSSIGNKGGSLKGSLDGQNHKITGLWQQNTTKTLSGLVAAISSSGAIRNLSIETATGKKCTGINYTAVLAGYNYGTIENCKVSGSIQGDTTGCITGYNSGTINNCSAIATVQGNNAGCITGYNSGTINNCSAIATVQGNNAGGIAGYNSGTITNCIGSGSITTLATLGLTGGIAGQNTGSISQCEYNGTLSSSVATSHIGGIVGLNSGLISTSFSSGTISASGATAYAGGIAGDNFSVTSEINNSESGMNINSTGTSTVCGGIVGITKGKVTNCYATGNIASAYRGSGVVGYMDGTSAKVLGCVGLNTNISGKNSVCRVLGGIMNSATAPALTDNYGCKDMLITINGVVQSTPADNYMQGTAKDRIDLKKQLFYEGMGWSFTSNWYIIEGFDYPYLRFRLLQVTGVTLNKSTTNLNVGSTETLTATIAPTNATYQNVNWTSSNVAVATVDVTGKVTAVSPGAAIITATTVDQTKTAQCTVTATQPVTGVTLNKSATTLNVSASETLNATIAPTTANNQNVTWASSNTNVATVDVTGKITAVAVGTATITVTTVDQSKTAQCVVTVVQPVTGVTLNKSTTTLNTSASETLTATIAPTTATNKNVTWLSSNTAVATVDATGKITAVTVGTATITVTTVDQSKTAQCVVTVLQPVIGVTLNKSTTTLKVNANESLTATITPATATNKNITWASSNTAVATVDITGKITGVSVGTATITVTTVDQSKTAQCVVTVILNVGLNDIINDSFKIYPNPVKNIIFIQSDITISKAEIYSVNGQLMLIKAGNDLKTLDVSELIKGSYTIRLFSDDKAVIKRMIMKK